jgi:hypothetical protein
MVIFAEDDMVGDGSIIEQTYKRRVVLHKEKMMKRSGVVDITFVKL